MDYISPHDDLDFEYICILHDIPARHGAPKYQVWLRKVERFKRYLLDNSGHGQTGTQAEEHIDKAIQVYSHNLVAEDVVSGERTAIQSIHKG